MIEILENICKEAKEIKVDELIEKLKRQLYLLQEITIKISQRNSTKEKKEEWFEMVSFFLDGIEQKDRTLLIDCIKYAIIPYLKKEEWIEEIS